MHELVLLFAENTPETLLSTMPYCRLQRQKKRSRRLSLTLRKSFCTSVGRVAAYAVSKMRVTTAWPSRMAIKNAYKASPKALYLCAKHDVSSEVGYVSKCTLLKWTVPFTFATTMGRTLAHFQLLGKPLEKQPPAHFRVHCKRLLDVFAMLVELWCNTRHMMERRWPSGTP